MTFLFPILLGGLALAGIPVLLHLIVRQKPKRLAFPAFRFLVQQRRSNVRKLRLRHLLLLALRVFLIAAMCLLLARPRLFHRVLGLDGERPVSAVLVFDTSASMEFRSSDNLTRLDEARERARQLLDELPAGSQVAVLDSADARRDDAPDWLSLTDARQRVGNLKLRPANAPLTQALLKALTDFDQADAEKGTVGPPRLRLLAVFSDRTRGSWDGGQVPAIVDKLDRLPPPYEGLIEARGQVGALQDLLCGLRATLPPPAGKDYAEQSLSEALAALQNDLAGLAPEVDRWPAGLTASVRQVRRLCRELIAQLAPVDPSPAGPAPPFRAKLRGALAEMVRGTGGAQMLFFDVGMETPVDQALVQVELPRTSLGPEQQVFAEGETFTLQAIVHATGKDAPIQVVCQLGAARPEFKGELKADARQVVPFQVGQAPLLLKPGDNSIEVRLATDREPPPYNHRRYVTVRVQPARRVVVIADDPQRLGPFARGLASLRYRVDVQRAANVTKESLAGAAAVYLAGVDAPEAKLWELLAGYVRNGGGLGIVPAGNDQSAAAYAQPAALKLMPGTFAGKLDGTVDVGSPWRWDPPSAKYGHSFMKRFQAWKDNPRTDFIRYPRGVFAYWAVTPRPDEALVLVEYDDPHHKPAVLERLFDAKSAMHGRVLLFTTPLDEQKPAWNNYVEGVASFYVALMYQATGYLVGESVPPQLNFTLGRDDPVVALPPGPALAPLATLTGPDLQRPLALEPGATQIVMKDLAAPGNYVVEGKTKESGALQRLAAFSLNVPAEESDLTKVPAAEIEPLFPGDALMTLGRLGSLHDALQSYRNEPLDLMPYFMLAILFALALENLLANRFYRQAEA